MSRPEDREQEREEEQEQEQEQERERERAREREEALEEVRERERERRDGESDDDDEDGSNITLDVGGVLAAWIVLAALENLVVGVGFREQFAGSWEMAHARWFLTPIAIAAAVPFALLAVGIARLVASRNARALSALACLAAIALAMGVSEGRHMASPLVRVPFVAVVGLLAVVSTSFLVRRVPLERPKTIAAACAGVAIGAWLADALVLPRLYPAFHAALLAITLGAWATTYLFVRGERSARGISILALLVAVFSIAWTQRAARAVVADDNLRRVLVEHAPLLGRAVVVASRIAPPLPLEDDVDDAQTTAAVLRPKTTARTLDWSGRDIVVITVDALRADHVSSYGYRRPTTPNIDQLAARGARFDHAYCPTPHTSYSVTSMMTGKYMRPLLAMGTGDDSETWAGYLRRYGFRTAGFYPPAVFFIDEHRFQHMKSDGLGFEYRKEEFAAPELRRSQILDYVSNAPKDKPLFLWVHLFEPHEPYVKNPQHTFGSDDAIDAYDSEIATADAEIGAIALVVEQRRPGAIFVISADHGEEFGDHGGHYHGTTVYEEQVRVPLVVVAPGVAPRVVSMPVQTIDLLPTMLAALDIPQPARVRGRDLGSVLAGTAPATEEGLAFAETDDYTLVARGDERLVCLRKIASCTLFDIRTDPLERKPIVDRPARVQELRKLTAAIERENGKLESNALPEALRRGLQGDADAAEDVATLFDDARVEIRREAARCAFRLKVPAMMPQLRRALLKDEDALVKRWSALAITRIGPDPETRATTGPLTEAALREGSPPLRLAAALALAEHDDPRGEGELVARWEAAFVPDARSPGELEEAREILTALAKIRARTATPVLVRSLDDVRLRPFVVDALGDIGDPRAQPALLTTFAGERYVDVRPKEARALLRVGAREALLAPLRRFAGVPEPMLEALEVAREAGLLVPTRGGWRAPAEGPPSKVDLTVTIEGSGAARLLVEGLGEGSVVATVDGAKVPLSQHGVVWMGELPLTGPKARVVLTTTSAIGAFWIVRRAPEIPPPPPREWQGSPAGLDGGLEGGKGGL